MHPKYRGGLIRCKGTLNSLIYEWQLSGTLLILMSSIIQFGTVGQNDLIGGVNFIMMSL